MAALGTVWAVSAVTRDGRFVGGALFPGLDTSAWSMHARTSRLPRVRPAAPPGLPGGDTESAILSGIVFAAAGGLDRIMCELRSDLGAGTHLVLTWNPQVTGSHLSHKIELPYLQTESGRLFPKNVIMRVACHLAMDRIPDQGLAELAETLVEIHEFYSLETSAPPLLPEHHEHSATLGNVFERPEFRFDAE